MIWDRLSHLIAKFVLRLYPRAYRRRFATEWEEVAEDMRQDLGAGRAGRPARAAGVRVPVRWLALIAWDTVRALPVAYIAALRHRLAAARDRFLRSRQGAPTTSCGGDEALSASAGPLRRRKWRGPRSGVSWLDVKLGIRMLIKHPGLTLVGGVGLAVGVAISVSFYYFTGMIFYPTLPLDEGERIVALENRDIALDNEERRSLHDFFMWREELESVVDLTAFRTVERNLTGGDEPPELVHVAEMTASGFRLARVPPLLGRYFVPDDEREGAPPVVVIGYDVWRNRFARDSAVIGRTVRLGSVVHTVVGIMPDGFAFPQNHQYWTPLRADISAYERREGPAIYIAGRLLPGVTMDEAQAELSAIGRRTATTFPETHELLRPMVMPYTHSLSDVQGVRLWAVIQYNLMMSLVLIVVALNVAVLVYARTAARRGEIAMRSALGASRGRIVAQLFAEALVLSLGASALGVALAQVGIGLGTSIFKMELEVGLPFWMDTGLRSDTVLFAVALAVAIAVVTGVLPALQSTGRRMQIDLRQLSGTGMRLGRTWTTLIVAQVAIAVAALPATVDMAWESIRQAATRRTYPAEEFAVAFLAPEAARAPAAGAEADPGEESIHVGDHLAELIRRLEAEPAVASVTFVASLPDHAGTIRVEGVPAAVASATGDRVASIGVHPGFVDVFDGRMLSGRSFEPADTSRAATAVIVSRSFVQRILGGNNALGRRIRYVSDEEQAGLAETAPVRWYEIVGVVEDLETNAAAPELVTPAAYYPVAPSQIRRATVTVRLRASSPAEFAPRFRQITVDVDPSLRLGTVRSLADSDRQERLAARLTGLAVGLVVLSVLLLSAAGIYAMMSFAVTQRRKEIGIRSALGAQPRQVLRSVFARSGVQVAIGLGVGLAAAAGLERVTGGGLMSGRGAVLLPALAILFGVVGLLAGVGPVRQGLRIQPTEALRGDG